MAVKTLINDVGNSWINVANWQGGVVPVTDDTVRIPNGDYVITGDLDISATVDDLLIDVGNQFSGQIGTSGSPLTVGVTGGGTLMYNAPLCQNFHISATMTAMTVLNTHPTSGSLTTQGGTITNTYVHGGTGLILAAGGTYTNVYIDGADAYAAVEDGNTITLLKTLGGKALCSTQVTTTDNDGGLVELRGASKTFAAVNAYGGGRVILDCSLSTITAIVAWYGNIDATRGTDTITITNATAWSRSMLNYGAHVVESNNALLFGNAQYNGGGTPERQSPGPSGYG